MINLFYSASFFDCVDFRLICGCCQISKALIDLRIETTNVTEKVDSEKFELANKILTFENDIMELEMKLEKAQKRTKVRSLSSLVSMSHCGCHSIGAGRSAARAERRKGGPAN